MRAGLIHGVFNVGTQVKHLPIGIYFSLDLCKHRLDIVQKKHVILKYQYTICLSFNCSHQSDCMTEVAAMTGIALGIKSVDNHAGDALHFQTLVLELSLCQLPAVGAGVQVDA